jgi:hypothetical protein
MLFREKGIVPVVDRKRSNRSGEYFFTYTDLKNIGGKGMGLR